MPDAFDRLLLVTLVLLVVPGLPAAEQASVDSATAVDQLKAVTDKRTILQSSVWLDTEWDQFNGAAKELTWTLAGLFAWRVHDPGRLGVAT